MVEYNVQFFNIDTAADMFPFICSLSPLHLPNKY